MMSPINNVEAVKMLKRAKEFSGVKAAPILVELSLSLQVIKEFSPIDWNGVQYTSSLTFKSNTHQRTSRDKACLDFGKRT